MWCTNERISDFIQQHSLCINVSMFSESSDRSDRNLKSSQNIGVELNKDHSHSTRGVQGPTGEKLQHERRIHIRSLCIHLSRIETSVMDMKMDTILYHKSFKFGFHTH